ARSAVSAAAGGTAPAAVAALTSTVIRTMALAKLKVASAVLAMAAALASVGVVALGSWRHRPSRAALAPPAARALERPPGPPRPVVGGDARGPRPGGRSRGPARRRGDRADRLPRSGDGPGARGDQRARRPVHTAGALLAAQLGAPPVGRGIPLGGRLGPGI